MFVLILGFRLGCFRSKSCDMESRRDERIYTEIGGDMKEFAQACDIGLGLCAAEMGFLLLCSFWVSRCIVFSVRTVTNEIARRDEDTRRR